jgi:outer membrane protein assembly factor BamB
MAVTCAAYGAAALPYDGVVVWTFAADDRGVIVTTPLVADGRIYVGAALQGVEPWGGLYCIDPANGKPWWCFTDERRLKPVRSSPCLADGRLFFGEGSSELHGCHFYCLDAATGKELWRFPQSCAPRSAPCVAGDRVYFAAGKDGVYCLDARTGEERWHYTQGLGVTTPAVSDSWLYVGGKAEVLCLHADTGQARWRAVTDMPVTGPPAVDAGRVLVGLGEDRAGALLCLDASTGRCDKQYGVGGAVVTKPFYVGDNICFGSRDGYLHSLSLVGSPDWNLAFNSPVDVTPGRMGDQLFVVTRRGLLYCLDAGTGRIRGRFDIAGHAKAKPCAFSSPTPVSGRVYVGSGLDHLVTGRGAVLYSLNALEIDGTSRMSDDVIDLSTVKGGRIR